ncbi:DUF2381 family protein [Hyalangium sp.]|uniref:DUF2381 family protein n=1 Tax=Hyalangium sp. TaxID=2028555 RepID=UPI002D4C2D24|nr:DUF2381 family protein [Hyalangium sp.]HYI02131.1 DUF2381 family protein [Hyalangium sp.]
MTWPFLALSLLVVSAASAQPQFPARQRQDRRASLPTTSAEPIPEVYVAAGNLTLVAFNGPLDRDSLVVDRTRFKWVDVGDRILALEPITDLGPGERLIMQVGFKDRALPAKAVLAVISKAEMMDGKVEVDRRANTPEALLAALTQKEAELEDLKARSAGSGPAGLVLSEWLNPNSREGVLSEGTGASRWSLRRRRPRPMNAAEVCWTHPGQGARLARPLSPQAPSPLSRPEIRGWACWRRGPE